MNSPTPQPEQAHPTDSYERQLGIVENLVWPPSDHERTITWCIEGAPVGLARSPCGHIEIFLAGRPLEPRSEVARANLEHQEWFRADGEPLPANRLLLPAAGHFDQVAAFLCTELLRSGAADDLERAFRRTEPMIELAIERLRLTDQAIVGLCGELVLLLALLREATAGEAPHVLESWKGHRDTARDFQLAEVGVEVKATTGSTSSHPVQGVHQVEVGHGVDGVEEDRFFLVSIGLHLTSSAAHNGEAPTLPSLVEAVLEEADRSMGPSSRPVKEAFLDRVKSYGAPTEIGYDHQTMADHSAFGRHLRTTFVRCYDMRDEAVRVLRSTILDELSHVEPGSVHFRLRLPTQLRGDINPVVGLEATAKVILQRYP